MIMRHRFAFFVACLSVASGLSGNAIASSYNCPEGELRVIDASGNSCSTLRQEGDRLVWPLGTTLAMPAISCESCPTPDPKHCMFDGSGEPPEYCECMETEEFTEAEIHKDGVQLEVEWSLSEGDIGSCSRPVTLTTSLLPGVYEITVISGSGTSKTYTVIHTSPGEKSSDDSGCTQSRFSNSPVWINVLLLSLLVFPLRRFQHR